MAKGDLIQFRVGAKLAPELDQRCAATGLTPGEIVKRDSARYYQLLALEARRHGQSPAGRRAGPTRRSHAPYNRGNPLIAITGKVALSERQALEKVAAADGKSVSAAVRDAIQRYVRGEKGAITDGSG